jgi:hypothetical protein
MTPDVWTIPTVLPLIWAAIAAVFSSLQITSSAVTIGHI